jgi:large subunit ribosomal protein L32
MAHPKSRISKQRKRKRRTHYKATVPTITVCQTTGESHQPHRAYYDADGNMFYNGNMLVRGPEAVLEEEAGDDEGEA